MHSEKTFKKELEKENNDFYFKFIFIGIPKIDNINEEKLNRLIDNCFDN